MPVTCDALTPLHPRASGLVVPVGSVASGHRGSAQTAGDGNMPCTWRWKNHQLLCEGKHHLVLFSLFGIMCSFC